MKNIADTPKWVKDSDVAKMLGYGIQTLRNHRARGVGLPFSKVGRSIRYKLADVYDYMEKNKVTPED
jgi:hypothetical protein